jgi:hypothetical protein
MPIGKAKLDATSSSQIFINRLDWENGYAHVINGVTRGDALLDVYLVRPKSLLISCTNEQGINYYCWVLLEVEREENYC